MNAPKPTAHLIFGPTASGKSTFALKLVEEVNGVRFAVDEWMSAMFGSDVPATMDLAWIMPRVARCQAQIWSVAEQILGAGRDVVLELGLLRRADRAAIKSKVEHAGYAAVFHFVDADVATRRERLLRRNAEKGATFTFEVTPVMFDTMESYFERPMEDELSSAGYAEARSSQIAAVEERLQRAMLASDIEALDALVSPDLVFTSHTGAVLAKQDDLDMYRSGALVFQAIDLSDQKIVMTGHVAVVSVRARLSGMFGGEAFKENIQFSRTWCRSPAGHWQIVAGHATRLNLEINHANI